MKRIIKIALFVILMFFMGYMLSVIIKKVKRRNLITEQIQSIPQFSFMNSLNQNVFSNDSIENEKACLIIYYHSECDHCQYEAEEISKYSEQFENYQVIMISFEPVENILIFREKYNLNQPFIKFLQDTKYQFDDIFGHSPIPTLFIYNKDKTLVKQFKGEVKVESLLKYLAE
jgi:peroxiredoxin